MPWQIIAPLFLGQFHRSVLLRVATTTGFQNWTNILFSSEPNSKLYPSIFQHKPIFGTVLLNLSFFFLFLFPFPANSFRNVLLQFPPPLFLAGFIELYCYTFLLHHFFLTFQLIAVTLSLCYGTLLTSSSHIYYSLSSDQFLLLLCIGSNICMSLSSLIKQTWL